jgi:malonate transporter
VLKTVVNPILTFLLVTYVFAMDPLWSQAAVILSAMPAAVNAYVIAQQYNVYFKTVSVMRTRAWLCWTQKHRRE